MGQYLDDLWNDLEQTWDLAMKVNDLSETERGDPNQSWKSRKYFAKISMGSNIIMKPNIGCLFVMVRST